MGAHPEVITSLITLVQVKLASSIKTQEIVIALDSERKVVKLDKTTIYRHCISAFKKSNF